MSAASPFALYEHCLCRAIEIMWRCGGICLSVSPCVPCPLEIIGQRRRWISDPTGLAVGRELVIGLMIETVVVVPPVREELDRPGFGVVSGLHKGKVTGLKFHISLGTIEGAYFLDY